MFSLGNELPPPPFPNWLQPAKATAPPALTLFKNARRLDLPFDITALQINSNNK
jgi:hypothetical protein